MLSKKPNPNELLARLLPYFQNFTRKVLADKGVTTQDAEDYEGDAMLRLVKNFHKVETIWQENLENLDNLRKIRKFGRTIIKRAVASNLEAVVRRRAIIEVTADSQTVAYLSSIGESNIDPEDYCETPEDRIILRMFLRGDDVKRIADQLCLTQKETRERMEALAMAIQADQAREARLSTRPAAKI